VLGKRMDILAWNAGAAALYTDHDPYRRTRHPLTRSAAHPCLVGSPGPNPPAGRCDRSGGPDSWLRGLMKELAA
jgi:hypothetical protein